MFQFNNLLPNLTALENIALPLVARGHAWRAALDQASEELAKLGLTERSDHRPDELSGGEQQRVALARAIISRPAIVLADEPTGDLDAHSARTVTDLMRDLNRTTGITFILATHNMDLKARASQVLELSNGHLHSEDRQE